MIENNNQYKVEGNKLWVDTTLLSFDFPIQQAVEVSGMLIVLLEKPPGKIYNENVFGISLIEKKIRWQIVKLVYSTGVDCPFISILIFEGKLRLNNWCDIYLIVNPTTGEILERSFPAKY